MHPDLEFFLEDAFDGIEPAIPGVGRVVVEPDYEAEPDESEKSALAEQLLQLVRAQRRPGDTVPDGFPVLSKYVRRVSLKADTLPGPWVEVAPPGSWI